MSASGGKAGEGYVQITPRLDPRFGVTLGQQVQSTLAGVSRRMTALGAGMQRFGASMSRSVTLPIVGLGVVSAKFATDAEEIRNKVRVTFKGMADDILQWSRDSVDRIGLASFSAQDMAAQFGLLFQAAELPGPKVVELSKQFTQLAGDMASFFNVPFEQALDTLRSGLVGETEPLRRFGVLLSEARVQGKALELGLADTTEEISEQDKVTARAAIIMDSLAKAQGDFARTSGSAANQLRSAKEQMKEAAADLGSTLLPVLTKDVLPAVREALDWFGRLPDSTKSWAVKFGLAAAAFGPLVTVLGTISRLGGGVLGVLGRLGRGVSGVGGVLGGRGGVTGTMQVSAGTVYVNGALGPGGPGGPMGPGGVPKPRVSGMPWGVGGLLGVGALAYGLGTVDTAPTDPGAEALMQQLAAAGKTIGDYNAAVQRMIELHGEGQTGAQLQARALEDLGIGAGIAAAATAKAARELRHLPSAQSRAGEAADDHRQKVEALAASFGAIPRHVRSQVTVDVSQAVAAINAMQGRLDALSASAWAAQNPGGGRGGGSRSGPDVEARHGFAGTITRRTHFLVGEGGEAEDVLIVPHSKGGIRRGGHGRTTVDVAADEGGLGPRLDALIESNDRMAAALEGGLALTGTVATPFGPSEVEGIATAVMQGGLGRQSRFERRVGKMRRGGR